MKRRFSEKMDALKERSNAVHSRPPNQELEEPLKHEHKTAGGRYPTHKHSLDIFRLVCTCAHTQVSSKPHTRPVSQPLRTTSSREIPTESEPERESESAPLWLPLW